MRVMVLGASGMAGHVVYAYLSERGYDVYSVARKRKATERNRPVDVMNNQELDEWLDEIKPAVVVNCIGLLQKACEQRPDKAVYINSYLPQWLANKYINSKTKLIHLSTDCVFSGKRGGYTETDVPDGETIYDRSKALGEVVNNKDLTFRMSIIGPDCNETGTGLFHWFMNQKGEVNGYSKVMWSGVTTIELSRAIDASIQQSLTGLYQLSPKTPIDKYNLLLLFKDVFERNDVEIKPHDGYAADKSLINTRNDFRFDIRSYREQIEDMRSWIEAHTEGYWYVYGRTNYGRI